MRRVSGVFLFDSSSLISLAKIKALYLIHRLGVRLITIKEVYEESVVLGLRKGLVDAQDIFMFFGSGEIEIADTITPQKPFGVSHVDACVIYSAAQYASVAVSNDNELRRKALESFDVSSVGSPDILRLLFLQNELGHDEYHRLLDSLVNQHRISANTSQKYKEV